MRKLAIALAFVGIMIGFATTASAQNVRVHAGRGGVGISINSGHGHNGDHRNGDYRNGGNRNGGHRNDGYRNDGHRNDGYRNDGHRNGGFQHWGGDYRHYPRGRAFNYPTFSGGRYYYENRSYNYYPETISVTVWEYRQVQTRYGWQNVEVQVRVAAYWDSYFNAYVYRDSYGRQHVIDN
jgi:hypothetical protein